jgi:tetratricopeptide (TPR) repeat protein
MRNSKREANKKRTRRPWSVPLAVAFACFLSGGNVAQAQSPAHDALESGVQALKAGEFAHAQLIFTDLVKRSRSAENVGYLAMAEAGTGKSDQAIAHFQESIRLGNDSAAVHYNLGVAFLNLGRRKEGIREFRLALTKDARFLAASYPLGVALLEEGRAREALPHLEQAHKLSPQEPGVWFDVVRAEFESGSQEAALRTVDLALTAIPDNSNLTVALANLCRQHGQARKARYLLEDASVSSPRDSSIGLLLARVSLQDGEPKETLAAMDNVPPHAGAPGEVTFLKGVARGLTGDFAAAQADLSSALQADPHNVEYLVAYAWLQQRQGHYEEALTTLRGAHELGGAKPTFHFRRAVSYFYLGAYAQAVEACKDALRLDSRFAEAYLLMGTVLLQQQSFQTAQSAFQDAIALKSNVALFHTLLGVALYKDGKIALAGKELNQALVLDPQSAPAYFYRARLQARQGERRKAIADLETAVALDSHYRKAYAELARLYTAEGQSDKAAGALANESTEVQSKVSEDERMLQEVRDISDLAGGLGMDMR